MKSQESSRQMFGILMDAGIAGYGKTTSREALKRARHGAKLSVQRTIDKILKRMDTDEKLNSFFNNFVGYYEVSKR